jgi:ABC-type bacteriocin/lantibiotic exporter with double-glycine peptidase domain
MHYYKIKSCLYNIKVAGAETRAYTVWSGLFSIQRRINLRLDNFNNWFQVFNTTFSAVCSIAIYGFLFYYLIPAAGASGLMTGGNNAGGT